MPTTWRASSRRFVSWGELAECRSAPSSACATSSGASGQSKRGSPADRRLASWHSSGSIRRSCRATGCRRWSGWQAGTWSEGPRAGPRSACSGRNWSVWIPTCCWGCRAGLTSSRRAPTRIATARRFAPWRRGRSAPRAPTRSMRTRTSAVPGRASRTGWSCSLRCSIPISSRAHRSKAERWCGRSSYIVPCGDRFPMRRLAFLALTLATGCSDALEKTSSAGQGIGVINVSDLSLVSATDFSVTTRSWPGTTAGPSAIAGGGRTFVVTLAQANAVRVSLLVTCPPDPVALCARPDYVLPLRAGSEPDGVAIQDDSIAWIANRALNSVTRLNYFTGDTTSVAAGVLPRAGVLAGSRVFVVNSNLVGGVPAGPSWLTSFECCGVRTPDSIPLTGLAAGFAVVGDDSLLYVVAAGRSGAADGKLSIGDPKRRTA